jgi:hypothetical protein
LHIKQYAAAQYFLAPCLASSSIIGIFRGTLNSILRSFEGFLTAEQHMISHPFYEFKKVVSQDVVEGN